MGPELSDSDEDESSMKKGQLDDSYYVDTNIITIAAAFTDETIRTADELSKMMAFSYYGAAKLPCLDCTGDRQERIPKVVTKS
ncbi:hypothetical protein V6N13_094956 [Hibiscus sabdariffa]|uniref:Uncharacterized protein n=1 Tax=Hibiscus sabdariffa TaxID=183260 RepID=A0ABR2PT53_9ROSI